MRISWALCGAMLAAGAACSQDDPDAAAATAQESTVPQDLLTRVRTTYQPGEESERPTEFRSTLRITPLRGESREFEVDLDVMFRWPRFIRYQVVEEGQTMQRGIDETGPWRSVDGKVESLDTGRHSAAERDEVRRHARLARQLVEYLQPADVLARLHAVAAVENGSIRLSRRDERAATIVTGTLDTFPLYAPPDPETPAPPVRLRAWLDRENAQLLALEVRPFDASGEPATAGEFTLIAEHVERQGRLVPTRLSVYRIDKDERHAEVQIVVRSIDLAPGLSDAELARPK